MVRPDPQFKKGIVTRASEPALPPRNPKIPVESVAVHHEVTFSVQGCVLEFVVEKSEAEIIEERAQEVVMVAGRIQEGNPLSPPSEQVPKAFGLDPAPAPSAAERPAIDNVPGQINSAWLDRTQEGQKFAGPGVPRSEMAVTQKEGSNLAAQRSAWSILLRRLSCGQRTHGPLSPLGKAFSHP